MGVGKNLFFFLSCNLLLLRVDSECQKSFKCGPLGSLKFPFTKDPACGLFVIEGCDSESPKRVRLGAGGHWYKIRLDTNTKKLVFSDRWPPENFIQDKICLDFTNLSLPHSISFTFSSSLTLVGCCSNQTSNKDIHDYFRDYHRVNCNSRPSPPPYTVYYRNPTTDVPAPNQSSISKNCSVIQFPVKSNQGPGDEQPPLSRDEFTVDWNVSEACYQCYHGGQCLTDHMKKFYCERGNRKMKLILAICLPGAGVLLLLLVTYIFWQRKKKVSGRYFLSRNISSNPSSKSDVEGGSFYFGIPIFSYTELEDATNNFDPSKELGDGGFGTVYYGKLRDGREVAIKRLYEHNYRRVEQFLNEIKILTGLRHPNLVSLYGCTSRRSRELLLVYEYIPNGTVADHLHGERAKEAPLTWPIRMNIAIETATALAYLHKSDIIHRDVKTNNILLDNNFCVKVADFGLSRLFPNNVTHISTAPQGTPGYVDPEYHQCYQLTDRSDVYSFGVVLIELISSMPAVDISRHRHEINLANLAVNRIQMCAFDELIDPSLGYDSDAEVTRMTTSVAELAFRCLQLEKDMRPSMDEVVAFLKDIQGGEDCNFEQIKETNGSYSIPRKIPPSPETDDVILLKNKNFQSSPTAVTDRWASSGSTTAGSIG